MAKTNTNAKTAALILALVLAIVYSILPQQTAISLGLSSNSPIVSRLSYQLVHLSALHVAINIYALLVLVFICRARFSHCLLAFLIAALIPSILINDTPICGLSVLNYALTGLITTISRRTAPIILINFFVIALQYAFPAFAATPHLYGFVAGMAIRILIFKNKS